MRSSLAKPSMRRAQASFFCALGVDSGLVVLLAVAAWSRAGAPGVAAIGVARVIASILFGILAAAPLARWRADRILVLLSLIRAGAAAIAAAVIVTGADGVWLLAVAGLLGGTDGVLRPSQSTLLPALATTPEELVTANIATSAAEALGTFGGPLVAAFFIATGAPMVGAIVLLLVALAGLAAISSVEYEDQHDALGPAEARNRTGLGLAAGVAAIRRRPAIGVVIAGFALQTMVRGLLGTLAVVLSVELIGLGEAGVGILGAAMGIGGIIGIVAGLAAQRSTAMAFALALALWGLPIAFIGMLPLPVVAVLAFVTTGLANALLDIVGFTLLQRGCRNEERGSIFALFEGATATSAALGYAVAPILVAVLGIRSSLVVSGAMLPLAAIGIWLALRRSGAIEAVPWHLVERLRDVPAFRVLPLTGIERLVSGGVPVAYGAGDVLMRKGDPGDAFLVIDTGEVAVTDGDRRLATLGPGSGIGEIALLRGVPRTATVTAITDVTGTSFDAALFIAAVSGPAATFAAARVVDERLANSASAS